MRSVHRDRQRGRAGWGDIDHRGRHDNQVRQPEGADGPGSADRTGYRGQFDHFHVEH